jgi:hypothetical protein
MGRCYDHNFQRFFPIFGEKTGIFLKNQFQDPNFILQKRAVFGTKTPIYFAKYFSENNLKNVSEAENFSVIDRKTCVRVD